MAHDSGFRQGAHDFSHKPPRKKWGKAKGTKAFERRLAERFREHEQQAKPTREPAETETDAVS